jgi:xanthine dehydrogenase YagT iron-sulfur-binding subunit
MSSPPGPPAAGCTRRQFLCTAASSAALTWPAHEDAAVAKPALAADADPNAARTYPLLLRINGEPYALNVDPRTTLLDAIRDHAALAGTKKGCGHGQCGACTVHADGRRILSCMTLALMAAGHEITTIEGLSGPDAPLHPMQQAFIDQDAFQCGYCTPGQIMAAIACVAEGHASSDAEVREYLSGNLCRCAAYPNIVAAVLQGASAMRDR